MMALNKYANPVCAECHDMEHVKYTNCTNPCSHLVSWASHEATHAVIEAARQSVFDIKQHREEED